MASKRVFITIPADDYELLNYAATLAGQCRGQWCRTVVLASLYRELQRSTLLQVYEEGIQARRRERIVGHGR